MKKPGNRRRRLARWAVLWLAALNFLLWAAYSRHPVSRRDGASPAARAALVLPPAVDPADTTPG